MPLSAVRDHVGESPLQGLDSMEAEGTAGAGGVGRKYTTNSFYEDNNEVRSQLTHPENKEGNVSFVSRRCRHCSPKSNG